MLADDDSKKKTGTHLITRCGGVAERRMVSRTAACSRSSTSRGPGLSRSHVSACTCRSFPPVRLRASASMVDMYCKRKWSEWTLSAFCPCWRTCLMPFCMSRRRRRSFFLIYSSCPFTDSRYVCNGVVSLQWLERVPPSVGVTLGGTLRDHHATTSHVTAQAYTLGTDASS